MRTITTCQTCGKPKVDPSWEGDGAYPIPGGCECDGRIGGAKP